MFWLFKKKEEGSVYEKIKTLDGNVKDSFDNLKQDMKKVSDWITNFNVKEGSQEQKINQLEEKIEMLNMTVEHLNSDNRVVERSGRHLNEATDYNNEKNDIRAFNHVQPFNRSVQPFMNVQEHSNLNVLTPAQKQVIALLTYAGGPMSYDEISRGLGINEITARRHLNDIRRAGFGIKRKVSVKNRRNMFYLDDEIREMLAKASEPVNKSRKS